MQSAEEFVVESGEHGAQSANIQTRGVRLLGEFLEPQKNLPSIC